MKNIRISHPLDPKLNHQCEGMHLRSYSLTEVILPASRKAPARKAISIVIQGENLRSCAQQMFAFVGKVPVKYLRIAPDERSIEGILLSEPKPESYVEVILGDQDHVRHPLAFHTGLIRRIPSHL